MTFSRRPALTAALLAGLASAFAVAADVPAPPAPTQGRTADLGDVTQPLVDAYTRHLHFLADPALEGRLPGTPGYAQAAEYVEGHLRRLGLAPAFPEIAKSDEGEPEPTGNKTFRQEMDYGAEPTLISQSFSFTDGATTRDLNPGEDFNAAGYGASAEIDNLPITFVGYSIVAGQNDYLGYDFDTDLTGRVAMMLRFEPMDDLGRSKWADEGWSFAASLNAKFVAAERRNAEAIIIVTPPDADDDRKDEMMTVEDGAGRLEPLVDIPVIQLTADAARELVAAADTEGRSLDDLIQMANDGKAIVELGGATVSMDIEISREPVITWNVGAILPGQGELADEFVVLGAHLDHVGLGAFGSTQPQRRGTIHPGADDNASGSAGLMIAAGELTDAYDALPYNASARSILFLWFTAEESGLVGSRYYVENAITDIDKHHIMLNLDMIGTLGDTGELEVGGFDSAEDLKAFLEPIMERSGIQILYDGSVGRGRSDHANFDRRGIPNLFFFTGLTDMYHSPDDTIDTVDIVGGARIASLAADVALAAATDPADLVYAGQGQQQRQNVGGPRGVRVRVGIAPGDYSSRTKGILVARVFENTSAAEAGVQQGDIITNWDGTDIETVDDWMPLLSGHEPGDTIQITVDRNGEVIPLTMTLKARGTQGG